MFKRRRRDEDYYGPSFSEVLRIAFAAAFALCGFYLMFRLTFGPPLFGPAFQAQFKAFQSPVQAEAPPPPAYRTQSSPGEVSVGIAPKK